MGTSAGPGGGGGAPGSSSSMATRKPADIHRPRAGDLRAAPRADIAHWPAFNAIYAEWAGASRPARAVVPVPTLHHGLVIEVEAVAMIEPRRSRARARPRTMRGAPR